MSAAMPTLLPTSETYSGATCAKNPIISGPSSDNALKGSSSAKVLFKYANSESLQALQNFEC